MAEERGEGQGVEGLPDDAAAFERAAKALRAGEPAIIPTDTVFGLAVAVAFAKSPEVLYRIKRRDHGKPIAWLVSGLDALDRYGSAVPAFARSIAEAFWPGPLTLIVRASGEVPPAFRSQAGTVALRMPASERACALIERVGCPLATTSANISGRKATGSFSDLDPELLHAVPAVLADANARRSGVASTVLDCTSDHPMIVREGGITAADIRALG